MIDYTTYKTINICDNYTLLGVYHIDNKTVVTSAILLKSFSRQAIIYKEWRRKLLGDHFDDSELMDSDDPRLEKIADKFRKMGKDRLENRFATLLATKPQVDTFL